MALLAEELVEEWLNRDGFFTIRGLKKGHDEIDLLAVKSQPNSRPKAWHVEVQASIDPAGFFGGLKFENTSIEKWLGKKFKAKEKAEMREHIWPELAWEYVLVYAVLKREQEQIDIVKKYGVIPISLKKIIRDLLPDKKSAYKASSGDFAELVGYSLTCSKGA